MTDQRLAEHEANLARGGPSPGHRLRDVTDYEVSRRVTAPAGVATITGLIEDFRRWPAWSPWERLDQDLERTYSGPARGAGAAYAWEGDRKAGAGRMQITDQVPGRIEMALQFTRPMRSAASLTFHLTPTEGGTEVVWRMTGRRTLALRALGVVGGMDRLVGPDFERGLQQLSEAAAAEEPRA